MFQKTKETDIEFLKENVSIQSYCENVLGITEWTQQKGSFVKPRMEYAIPDSNDLSSLSVNLENNFFVRFSGKGRCPKGDILNFIQNTADCSYAEALDKLVEYGNNYLGTNIDREQFAESIKAFRKSTAQNVDVEFKLPFRYKNNKRLIKYMLDCRKINKNIVYYMLDENLMYQSWDCKAIFVSYDSNSGLPIFACVRDTNWNERITYGVKGSLVKQGWYVDNGSHSLVVTEAVVDAMAYMSILENSHKNFKDYNYLALTGCSKLMCIEYHLAQNANITDIFLAFDVDEAGETARSKAKKLLNDIGFTGKIHDVRAKHGKDINDELKFQKANS